MRDYNPFDLEPSRSQARGRGRGMGMSRRESPRKSAITVGWNVPGRFEASRHQDETSRSRNGYNTPSRHHACMRTVVNRDIPEAPVGN